MKEDTRVVQKFIDMLVGKEKFTYPARQDAPKPKDIEFAHVRLIEEYPVGIPMRLVASQTDMTTTYGITSTARLRFRVGIIESTGLAASKVMHGWTSTAARQLMIETGFGFIRCDPLSNEDAKQEKYWEFRQGFSIEFYATRTFEEVVDNITSLTIESRILNDDLTTITDNYEINKD